MDRTHNMGLPSGAAATNTTAWPSGERANDGALTVMLGAGEKAVPSGGDSGTRMTASSDDRLNGGRTAKNRAAVRKSSAASHAAHAREFRPLAATAAEPAGS